MPLPPAGADRRIGSADASSVQAEQTGGLTIALLAEAGNVTQVADVFLDGRHVGSTSALGRIDIKNLVPARSYLIKVQKTGFKMWAREVRFQKRGTQQLFVRLQALHNLSSAARTSSRPDAARGFAAGKVKRSPRKTPRSTRSNRFPGPQAAANYGTVEVLLDNSEPLSDAYVYVNQALWNGQSYTAPAQLQLPAGTYLIEVRKDGYFSAPPSQTIEIIDGESRTLRFILTAR